MILTEIEFNNVVVYCQSCIHQNKFPDVSHSDLPQVKFDTLQSIFSQIYVRHTKKVSPEIERDIHAIAKKFDDGCSLIDVARSYCFSPFKLAKLYAKHILKSKDTFNLTKLLNDDIKEICTLPPSPPASQLNSTVSNTADIAETSDLVTVFPTSRPLSDRVKADLIRCCLEDVMSSQTTECIKNCVGREYEELLYDLMRQKNMCFETESELRLQGKPKTPDVLLMVPLAVRLPRVSVGGAAVGSDDGREGTADLSTGPSSLTSDNISVVHWIDSKAMFGDHATCQEQMEQLQGYVNRYGRGLVIYWQGFVETLPSVSEDIVFADRFPDDW
eukprot:CAMPEP_0114417404 /NCGR_PEP_ID=MMETSP0103-20121206/2946_1 /TAXON_ID=37642 ORGANISM="Paraphysomonas imperforata, Strain PA2" /NCGR_SAMPLE_ID=MMETSP0103 /ASSEMBLY_ACC=CAM_ASM_000201 /LENGTH=329 /DNA_ID=CAMNT_0001585695 /DNA_START=68 /DNA_END=1054 /DNA_ORIENTATION=-